MTETEREDEGPGHVARVFEIAREIGLEFGVAASKRADMIASRILDEGNSAHTLAILRDGIAGYLRGETSEQRRKSERAGARIAELPDGQETAAGIFQLSLDFPIVVAGQPKCKLRHATPRLIQQSLDRFRMVKQGYDRTERILIGLNKLFQEMQVAQDDTVETLIEKQVVTIEQIAAILGGVKPKRQRKAS